MSNHTNCWKYLVLTFNVLFAMSAVVLFGFTGYFLYKLFIYRHFIGVSIGYPAILLLMVAIITGSVAWIGCRTATSMHQIHILITGVLITIIVVIEFSCFVWAMVVWDNAEIEVKSNLVKYFEHMMLNNEPNSIDTIRWDKIQIKFECCGVAGPADYTTKGHVPFSCCGQGPLDTMNKPYTADCSTLYQRGCGKQLYDYAKEHLLWTAIAGLLASLFQSTGIFCTFLLAHAIKKKRKTRAAIRQSVAMRDSALSSPDDSLLSNPSAPTVSTLPKY